MKKTAALHWHVSIRMATSYLKYLSETDPETLKQWSSFYKTGDVKSWAKQRIESILELAGEIWLTFSDDKLLATNARAAAAGLLESLVQAGFGGCVAVAGTPKTK